MSALLCSLPAPPAGCFYMTMARSDALFLDQTPEAFRAVHDSKLRVFEIFTELVEIQRLDFVVAISSFSGLVGIPGQSNYARCVSSLACMRASHLVECSQCLYCSGRRYVSLSKCIFADSTRNFGCGVSGWFAGSMHP
jgi:hypothetical protein